MTTQRATYDLFVQAGSAYNVTWHRPITEFASKRSRPNTTVIIGIFVNKNECEIWSHTTYIQRSRQSWQIHTVKYRNVQSVCAGNVIQIFHLIAKCKPNIAIVIIYLDKKWRWDYLGPNTVSNTSNIFIHCRLDINTNIGAPTSYSSEVNAILFQHFNKSRRHVWL